MKQIYLLERSRGGQPGNKNAAGKHRSVTLPPMSYDDRRVTIKRNNKKKEYNATPTSFARLGRLLGKGRRTVYTDVVTGKRTYPISKGTVGRWPQ